MMLRTRSAATGSPSSKGIPSSAADEAMAIMTALRRQSCIRPLSQPAADAGPAGGPALDWTGVAWPGQGQNATLPRMFDLRGMNNEDRHWPLLVTR